METGFSKRLSRLRARLAPARTDGDRLTIPARDVDDVAAARRA
jgi:hypothetical protein